MKNKLSVALMLSIIFCFNFSIVAFAESELGGAALTGWWTALGSGYKIFRAISLSIAALGIAFCASQFLTGSEKAMDQAKANIIRIVIAVIVILVLPLLLNTGISLFGKNAWNPDPSQNNVGVLPMSTMNTDVISTDPSENNTNSDNDSDDDSDNNSDDESDDN